ncbi:hypothetical protein LB521_04290 [Mesorhizobium sp. BR-1-1-8]|uniref:hypothetical protein n=1 Tax=Mesorhizobium sp. BR-1-1-8 TaxID=2876659 RepID=UPI001CC8FFE4|nr:hypothetical protein [Mesorhizobium sp. BR-1-1-8]MBZ9980365.1 hypothetical protein [Mesorhizobium sp. BR-1-1-8]
MKTLGYLGVASAALLTACATPADKITAAYTSPILYQNLTCPQIATEAQAVTSQVAMATGNQNQKATGDAVAFTVGMVVFWPALFLMHGDGAEAGQLANLKGQMQALELASAQKGCGIVFQQPKAEPKQVKQGQTRYP